MQQKYSKLAEKFKILANPKRIEILDILKDGKEKPVSEIIEIMKIRKSNVSQHLAVLRMLRFISPRPSGKKVFYKLINKDVLKLLG